jgi:hypothetical protein
MPSRSIAGSFALAVAGASIQMRDSFNVAIYGVFSATIVLEKSFDRQNVANDGAATWSAVSRDIAANPASYTAPTGIVVSEPEAGIYYRLRCSSYVSGTANWRLSQ